MQAGVISLGRRGHELRFPPVADTDQPIQSHAVIIIYLLINLSTGRRFQRCLSTRDARASPRRAASRALDIPMPFKCIGGVLPTANGN